MQIRVAGHVEALLTAPAMESKETNKWERGEVISEPGYVEQLRYLIYQLKGAREHLAASVDHMDTVI